MTCRAALCVRASLRARQATPAQAATGAREASSTVRTHPSVIPGAGQRQHQERHGQDCGQNLRAPALRIAAAEPVQGDQHRTQARNGQRLEERERQHARRADGHGGRGRAQESQRQRGAQAEQAQRQGGLRAHARVRDSCRADAT